MASNSAVNLLSNGEVAQLPSYAEYMKLIDVSKNLSDSKVQQEYGFVRLKEVQSLKKDPAYYLALSELSNRR